MRCVKCVVLYQIFQLSSVNYWYWLITELFVLLHNGRDYCESS